jgi:regulator of RNase E activity RraA
MQGNADGLVAIPQTQAADIRRKPQATGAKEQQVRERIARRAYRFDVLNPGKGLESPGVVHR